MFHTAVLLVAQTGLGSNYTNWNITQCKTHTKCSLFCIPMRKPLQNLTGSQAAVRHWSVLDATGAKAKPNLPLQVSYSKQQAATEGGGNTVESPQGSTSPRCTSSPTNLHHRCCTAAPRWATEWHHAVSEQPRLLFHFYRGGCGQFEFSFSRRWTETWWRAQRFFVLASNESAWRLTYFITDKSPEFKTLLKLSIISWMCLKYQK